MHLDIYWPTPIFSDNFTNISDDDLKEIENIILNYKKETEGRVYSNRGGWQSKDFNLHNEENETIKKLFNEILGRIEGIKTMLDLEDRVGLCNYWYNVNEDENFNFVHIHPGALFAGVFYVKTIEKNGELSFFRPNSVEDYFYASSRKRKGNNIIAGSSVNYQPSNKLMLIFPAWLPHTVLPTKSKESRISIAFNIGT